LGRTAAPFGFFTIFVLIVPAIGMPLPLAPAPGPLQFPPAAERSLAAVLNDRLVKLPPPPAEVPAALGALAAARPTAPVREDTRRTHVVQPGDTLWSISRKHGVDVDTLARANSLGPGSVLRVGRELTIPPAGAAARAGASVAPAGVAANKPPARSPRPASASGRTVSYVVEPGDTLWSIAERHGTTVEDLMARNDLEDADRLRPGQRLVIDGRAVPRRQVAAQLRRAEPEMADEITLRTAGTFLWPSRGVLTSRFGLRRYRRHHAGIDIAAPHGTPIYASRDGTVEFSGWKSGYGRVVFIDHGDGLVTVYGHASRLVVKTGETVKKGQLIATVGCTGRCTGSHLHFEVRVRGRAQNPLQILK
jgi:murein DD-endopeptidase MepM/ murein hydrolase activator NlpD